MSCRHQWAGAVIKGPVNHILVDQCEKCGKLRLQDAAPPAQGIDMVQLRKLADRWERTANDKDVAFKDRELIGMYDKGLMKCVRELRAALIDQRDAAPGVGNG